MNVSLNSWSEYAKLTFRNIISQGAPICHMGVAVKEMFLKLKGHVY